MVKVRLGVPRRTLCRWHRVAVAVNAAVTVNHYLKVDLAHDPRNQPTGLTKEQWVRQRRPDPVVRR